MKNLLELKVNHSGIHLKGLSYFHVKLLPYVGTKVLIKQKKEKLKVYSLSGVFICKVKAELFYVGGDSPLAPEDALARFSTLA